MNPQEELAKTFWDILKSETTASLSKNKRANTKLYSQAKACADATFNLLSKEINEKDYWKQRCEAAEAFLDELSQIFNLQWSEFKNYGAWQQLKK